MSSLIVIIFVFSFIILTGASNILEGLEEEWLRFSNKKKISEVIENKRK